jgi:hypothetical protein
MTTVEARKRGGANFMVRVMPRRSRRVRQGVGVVSDVFKSEDDELGVEVVD